MRDSGNQTPPRKKSVGSARDLSEGYLGKSAWEHFLKKKLLLLSSSLFFRMTSSLLYYFLYILVF